MAAPAGENNAFIDRFFADSDSEGKFEGFDNVEMNVDTRFHYNNDVERPGNDEELDENVALGWSRTIRPPILVDFNATSFY